MSEKIGSRATSPAMVHVENEASDHGTDHVAAAKMHEQVEDVDSFIEQMERDLAPVARPPSFFRPSLKDPRHFTWVMVVFASMGGILFGLDQSLISGANLTMPAALGFDSQQTSLINSFMPLGAVFGSFILGPANEYFGRRGAIILATVFYTIGAALEAGSVNYAMMLTGRLVLGLGIGISVGTCPVFVAESVGPKVRGNLVSLYQFNIALGEVLGFVVAAIFINVADSWRFILGSSLLFSTLMFIGYVITKPEILVCKSFTDLYSMLFLPESPRFLMHKGKSIEAFAIWKRIRGVQLPEARHEFYVMAQTVLEEQRRDEIRKATGRPVWMDFY